jgi:hypothetical protein
MSTPHHLASPQPGNPAHASTPSAAPPNPTGTTSLPGKLWGWFKDHVLGGLVVAAILAVVACVWGLIATSAGSTSARGAGGGFTAKVAWTNDGGGGGSPSSTLYGYTGPYSHIHEGQYPLGESLTVVCQTPRGRPIQVGPDYGGPDPTSTTWYRLDSGAWVPAVYVRIDHLQALPVCS